MKNEIESLWDMSGEIRPQLVADRGKLFALVCLHLKSVALPLTSYVGPHVNEYYRQSYA